MSSRRFVHFSSTVRSSSDENLASTSNQEQGPSEVRSKSKNSSEPGTPHKMRLRSKSMIVTTPDLENSIPNETQSKQDAPLDIENTGK